MRQIVLDTETTGLDANGGDRLIEIGCVEIVKREVSEASTFHVFINPEREVPEEAIAIHHITNEFLADKPVFAGVADQFIDYVRGAELIAHNAQFDAGFLDMELRRAGLPSLAELGCTVTDTLMMARIKGDPLSLDSLYKKYIADSRIQERQSKGHGALLDAEMLAQVYLAMTRGQEALTIDVASTDAGDLPPLGDVSSLKVVAASEAELAAHTATLDAIVKEGAKKQVRDIWREVEPAGADAPAA